MNDFNFCIMGTGSIANKFFDATTQIEGCRVGGVANRTLSRAEDFAKQHNIQNVYKSFEELLQKEKPDCVYIAVTQNAHKELIDLCVSYGVPVLCEKSMFMCKSDAIESLKNAEEKGVFTMEAMWSRFLPPIHKAKEWIDSGKIGKVSLIDFTIGFNAPRQDGNRFFNKANGGGACYDLGVYGFEMTDFFTNKKPISIKADCIYNEQGVDTTDNITLNYGDATASVRVTFDTRVVENMIIYGDKGRIELPHAHWTTEAILYDNDFNVAEDFKDTMTKNGFVYEVREAIKCVKERKIESDIVPHALTINSCELYDLIRGKKTNAR